MSNALLERLDHATRTDADDALTAYREILSRCANPAADDAGKMADVMRRLGLTREEVAGDMEALATAMELTAEQIELPMKTEALSVATKEAESKMAGFLARKCHDFIDTIAADQPPAVAAQWLDGLMWTLFRLADGRNDSFAKLQSTFGQFNAAHFDAIAAVRNLESRRQVVDTELQRLHARHPRVFNGTV